MQCLTNEIIFCGFRKHSLSGLQLQSGMQYVQRSDCRAANLQSFAAARHFCSAKILAGGLRWGWGSPPQSAEAPPAQRNFQRKFALRRARSARFVVPPTSNHSKLRRHTRQEQSQYRAAPGCQRDRGPSVSGGVQRNPFQGVPLGNFFLTVDAVLLCAAKKNGVETYQAARVLPVNPWSLDHGSSKKATCCGAGSIPKNMQKPQKPCSCKYIPLMLYCG